MSQVESLIKKRAIVELRWHLFFSTSQRKIKRIRNICTHSTYRGQQNQDDVLSDLFLISETPDSGLVVIQQNEGSQTF